MQLSFYVLFWLSLILKKTTLNIISSLEFWILQQPNPDILKQKYDKLKKIRFQPKYRKVCISFKVCIILKATSYINDAIMDKQSSIN